MTKKSIITIWIFSILIICLAMILIYLNSYKTITIKDIEDKNKIVKISQLPDLAISTEANYIRHRSLSDIFTQYKDDPSLREYFPSTFIYSQGTKR